MTQILTDAFLNDRDTYIHYSTKYEQLLSDKQKKESTGNKLSGSQLEKVTRVGFSLPRTNRNFKIPLLPMQFRSRSSKSNQKI